jgi:hypothetical protein
MARTCGSPSGEGRDTPAMPPERIVSLPALAVSDRRIARLERPGTPDPDAARELLRLALAVELDTGGCAQRWIG